MSQTAPHKQTSAAGNCWSSIGVRGDKSCDALAGYAHCRNCPVYSEIAATLFERAADHEPAEDWVGHHHDIADVQKPKDRSALIFRLGSQWLAIATQTLDEIVELRGVHRIPHRASPVVLGIANVRGELVVCLSLDRLMGIDADPPQENGKKRLLVLRSASGRLGVPVDEVRYTHAYESDDLLPAPATIAKSASTYTTGLLPWQGRTVARLDEKRVIEAFERVLG